MRCTRPISLPPVSGTTSRRVVPCGKCAACKASCRESWSLRLLEEAKASSNSLFVTLTYSDDNLPFAINPTLVKGDVQRYIKRLRKKLDIRYYAVGEYGSKTLRPHYHLLIFGAGSTLEEQRFIYSAWNDGMVHIGMITLASIGYVAKYHIGKSIHPYGSLPSFALMSKGIGREYLKNMGDWHLNDLSHGYYQLNQFKKRLPRYYKEKLYTRGQRATMGEIFKNLEKSYDIEIEDFKVQHPDEDYFEFNYFKEKSYNETFRDKSLNNDKL